MSAVVVRGARWQAVAAALTLMATAACGTGPGAMMNGSSYARSYQADGSATVAAGQALTIQLGDMYFRPNTLTVTHGEQVELQLHNGSPIEHNFTLQAFGISENVAPGQTAAVGFAPSSPGTYYFYCAVPGHAAAGMVGKITVQ